ncbi:putative outer membrane protein [Dolichospermum phage Dfl-JY23]
MSGNKEGLNDDQQDIQGQDNESDNTETTDIDAKLEARFKAFEDKINNALNGVVKKVEKKLTVPTPPESKKDAESDSKKPELNTIQALQAEMEKTRQEFEKQLESERQQRENDKRQVFLSSVESKISTAIANQGFDDTEAAIIVFKSMYGLNDWHPGTSGYVIYKKSEEDEGKTLESLVKEWSKSPVGKRFFNKNLPNGTGLDTPENTKQSRSSSKSIFEKRLDAQKDGFNIKM